MKPALLQAVLRVADARTSDADLLARFVQSRDESAFEELVSRHGPLVWSVCRQLLPHHADAEDAFQAVFLALIEGAARIRSGQALPSWLHGAAVRVAVKSKRTVGRRRLRETRAAVLEADRPIPDAAWSALMSAVHEEVQQLPDAERAAFVLCELEGVRQPDAAARLGWPLGTLSGRLCKARQRLIDQLSRRGIVPGVLVIGGLAGTAGVVPAGLVAKVYSFPSAVAGGISSTAAGLARGVVGGTTMRMKVLAAAAIVAGAIGITGGSFILSQAEAQNFGSAQGQSGSPAGAEPLGLAGGQIAPPRAPATPAAPAPGTAPAAPVAPVQTAPAGGIGPIPPGAGMAPFPGGQMMGAVGTTTWEYKFVDLKRDDKETFVKEIKQAGAQGWEYCGSERLVTGTGQGEANVTLVLTFKKRHGFEGQVQVFGGFGPGMMGGTGGQPPGMPLTTPGGPGGYTGGNPGPIPGMGARGFGGAGGVGSGPSRMPPAPTQPAAAPTAPKEKIIFTSDTETMTGVFKLTRVAVKDVAASLTSGFYADKGVVVVAEPVSNSIMVAASPTVFKQIAKVIHDIEQDGEDATKPRPVQPPAPPIGPARPSGPGMALPRPDSAKSGPATTASSSSASPATAFNIAVIDLEHAKAGELAQVLAKVFPDAQITFDASSNMLIVRASAETTQELTKLIKRLDVPAKP